ncbi:gamma-aminobutyric acid type B receptor subunit 2-like [Acanthaster planci]|uniref:Gamma-aminobutyric acid type B receptor subunit 2 n=1 Tax=Acanthaster planci TaxID=133434 RepID=A0A8B7YNB8_ACAPL|nr:gamma-aminobutyric acid type B receptor subunit 2-like [Acanthaster planci]
MFLAQLPRQSDLLFVIALVLLSLTLPTVCLTNITLGGLFSLGGAGSDWDGSAILQAALMALQHVNEDPTVLPDYHLHIEVKNSKCRPGEGMKGFVDLINEEPTKLMLLGASCSVVSQPVAETSQHWNLVQMSFSSASDVLSFKGRFPYFFRTNPAQSGLNTPRIALLKEYRWEKVAIIHDSSEYFTSAINTFSEELYANNLTVLAKESFPAGEQPTVQLQNIKDKDARIIVASAYEDGLQRVFCEAYHLGMYGSRYTWMIESWNSLNWWQNVSRLGCTNDQMYKVAENYVGTVFLNLRTDNKSSRSGLTVSQYEDAYTSFTRGVPYAGKDFASFGYDAVWAVALALHSTVEELAAENSSVRIEDFNYDNISHLKERFLKALGTLSFEGITGTVSFDRSGNRLAPFKIEQLIDGVEEDVGIYFPASGLQWKRHGKLSFTADRPPQDGPVREFVYLGIHTPSFAVFTGLAVLGMGMTTAFLTVNIVFRDKRLVKLSCPNVNNVIAVGCFMCYVDVIVAGLNQNVVPRWIVNGACLAQVWILPISFSLAFGGLFAKTWRVHVIFSNKTKRTKIYDSHLFAIIGVVVAVDIAINSVWTAYDPSQLVLITLDDHLDKEADKIIEESYDKCDSTKSPQFLWIGIILFWKGILLMYGAFLAWETRNVTMSQLNDSKFIAVAIYNVAVPSIIVAPLATFISTDLPGVSYILTASCILFGTTVTNCLIFIPKIIALWQERHEEALQDQCLFTTCNQIAPQNASSIQRSIKIVSVAVLKEKDKEIAELKEQLEQKELKIAGLMELLGKSRPEQKLKINNWVK